MSIIWNFFSYRVTVFSLFLCRSSIYVLGWYYIFVGFRQSACFLHFTICLWSLSIVPFIEHKSLFCNQIPPFLPYGLRFWKHRHYVDYSLSNASSVPGISKSEFPGGISVILASTPLHWTPTYLQWLSFILKRITCSFSLVSHKISGYENCII